MFSRLHSIVDRAYYPWQTDSALKIARRSRLRAQHPRGLCLGWLRRATTNLMTFMSKIFVDTLLANILRDNVGRMWNAELCYEPDLDREPQESDPSGTSQKA
ncbi:hypothetical protein PIIN_11420 [Serendipita indica DSM 11827]|uniref:Uncharacterized protein n=1 Tax=Serendipita indica (strain DSM 11827) TaxID=1109443 RepID=G4U1K0_SERID|nr:hypothetical protein PIIN_11420 [Serendipita indica DSM 11827]